MNNLIALTVMLSLVGMFIYRVYRAGRDAQSGAQAQEGVRDAVKARQIENDVAGMSDADVHERMLREFGRSVRETRSDPPEP